MPLRVRVYPRFMPPSKRFAENDGCLLIEKELITEIDVVQFYLIGTGEKKKIAVN